MKKYLSIDLDFWMNSEDIASLNFLEGVLGLVREHDIPLLLVREHQEMLRSVNNSDAKMLLNIDYHPDLREQDSTKKGLSDFNWINFVTWRGEGHFIWYYPDQSSLDLETQRITYTPDLLSIPKPPSAFEELSVPEKFGWKSIEKREGTPKIDNLGDLVQVGIAISPKYTRASAITAFQSLIGNYSRKISESLPRY